MTKLDDLEKLANLKKKGVLTEAEFEEQKKALLSANEKSILSEGADVSPFGRYIGCFKKYVTFSGRANRAEYWWFFLFNFLIGMATSFLGIVGTAYYVVSFLPGMAVAVRRLHDVNRSAWWYFLPLLVLIGLAVVAGVGMVVDYATVSDTVPGMDEARGALFVVLGFCTVIFFLVWVILLLVFMLMPGTKGDNRYGKVPL